MAEIGPGISRLLIDQSGDPITDDSSNALKVKLVGSDTIVADIGDVEIKGHAAVGQFALNVRTVGGGGSGPTRLPDNDCKHADIMANISNTGIVYIGDSGVSATTGIALYPGDVYSVKVTRTALLYCISTVSGDDINVVTYN